MKICNLDYLKSLSPDDPKFVAEMIYLFLKQAPFSIEEMNKCFSSSDWPGLQNHAHKLKSLFGHIGIQKEYKDTVNYIEEVSKKQENLEIIPLLLIKIEKGFQLASKELKEELKKKSI